MPRPISYARFPVMLHEVTTTAPASSSMAQMPASCSASPPVMLKPSSSRSAWTEMTGPNSAASRMVSPAPSSPRIARETELLMLPR